MKNIIVVDDDLDVREVFVFALENEGFRVTTFENGLKALEGISSMSEVPGLFIVDYLMPQMDGLSFISEMRKKYPDTFGTVPVAFTSALGSDSPEVKNLNDVIHLSKPMDLQELLDVVRKFCH